MWSFGAAWAGVASASGPLPRATADRLDDFPGSQVHALYVVPADLTDRAFDTDGTINASVSSFQTWMGGQANGRALRMDTFRGVLDVSFARLTKTDAELAANGPYLRDAIEAELRALGFSDQNKVYAVYYDGTSTFACGGGAWPPTLPGTVGAVYMRATYGAGLPCYDPTLSRTRLQIMDFAVLHEMIHTLGFVATCAPHHTRAGHTSDSPNDLMYAGDEPWTPSTLDAGRDDYFDADVAGCPDLADSPFVGPAPVPLTVTRAGTGSGTVTSAPAGIDCGSDCAQSYADGTSVTLTAAAASGSHLAAWAGCNSVSAGACLVQMGSAKSVTATFTLGTFADVPTSNPFFSYIEQLFTRGITTGCATNALGARLYCPADNVLRQQMAAFLIRAKGLTQLTPATPTFADVPASNPFYGYIERLYEQGITTGCGTNGSGQRIYCPEENVLRQQMAAFLIRAKGLTQLESETPTFADVPKSNPFYGYVERLYEQRITTGCGRNDAGQLIYCPGENVTREAMAAFLIRAFP